MRMIVLLLATLLALTVSASASYVAANEMLHGGHADGHGGGGGHLALHHGGPKVKATGKHHHKLKPPKPPKPPKPVKTGGLLHPHR